MPHQLNRTVPEWRILEDVLPLFSATLPWCVADNPSRGFAPTIIRYFQWLQPHQSIATTTAIGNETTLENFRADPATIEEYHPHYELPDHSYNICKTRLSELLSVLENVIQDSVIEVASKTKTTRKQQVSNSPQTQPWLDLQSWAEVPIVQAVTQFLPLPNRGQISAPASPLLGQASIDPEAASPAPQYQKLESLSLIIQECLISDKEITSSCSKFLKLKQTRTQFQEVGQRARVAKLCLISIAEKYSLVDQFRIRTSQKISSSNWENPMPWETTYRLFNMLSEKTCPGHEARFQLDGFKMDSEGECLPIDVFISSCPRDDPRMVSPSWQEGRYTYFMHDITPVNDMSFIHDLCFTGAIHEQARHSPPVSDIRIIEFDKLNAYQRWLPTERSIRCGATPTISLAHLLDNGFLDDMSSGGVFNVGDKAALALSLGRCLLHCFQGLLMEQEWSSHNIHFLYQRTTVTERIFNIHHPYVTCCLPKTDEEKRIASRYSTLLQNDTLLGSTVKPMDCKLSLWSFARLLLEIEKGQRIPQLSEPDILEYFNSRDPHNRWEYSRA